MRPGDGPDHEPELLRDRRASGADLAEQLASFRGSRSALVLGLARGGVPVGDAISRRLELSLDVFVVRRFAVPGRDRVAIGAVASGGVRVFDVELIASLGIEARMIAASAGEQQRTVERLERRYRDGRPTPALAGRDVVLVDDGVASGSSMRAAVRAVRPQAPASITVAIPVGPVATCESLLTEADDVVCPLRTDGVRPVADWYRDFPKVSDRDVRELLHGAIRDGRSARGQSPRSSGRTSAP